MFHTRRKHSSLPPRATATQGPCRHVANSPALSKRRRKMSGGMYNPNDLKRLLVWIVNDEISLVGLHQPEQKRQSGQIGAGSASQRPLRSQIASQINRFFNFVGGVAIATRKVCPHLE